MFNISSLVKFKDTIGHLLFKKIFFGYIIVVSILLSYQIYLEYNFAKKLVLKELITSEKSFSNVLAKSVWHFNESKINSQVEAIINAQTISGVQILTPLNEIISIKGTVPSKLLKNKKYVFSSVTTSLNPSDEDLISHKFDLIDEENSPNESLGTVDFFIKESLIFEIAQESIYLLLFSSISSAVVLWLLFIYFANKLLTIPLNNLIKASKELGEKKYNKVGITFNTEKRHELNTLADTFNTMSKDINTAFTEMKELHKIQEEQKKDLEEANKYKNDFLANMSHELKTPLNSINVISSVMMKNRKNLLNEEQVKNLSIINNCGNDLLYLINDVLDISKLEAGEIVLNMEQLDLKKIIHEIKDMFEPQTEEKNVTFKFEYDSSIGDIYSDEHRIKQIIKNLLSNAIKFVKEGTVHFLVTNMNNNVKIQVKDNGIGIDKNKLEHIFDRFKQADGSTSRQYGGTGLGLAICKELLTLLEGDIQVESEVNIGTTFTICIPKNKEHVEERIHVVEEKDNKTDILLFNNDPVSFLGLSIELKKLHKLIHIKDLDRFLEDYEASNYAHTIVDISSLSSNEIKDVLKILNENSIVVYNEDVELLNNYNFTKVKKPFNKKDIIAHIENQ